MKKLMRRLYNCLRKKWYKTKRKLWIRHLRRKNKNHEFSLITNNCVGGVICHDLGEQFRSPTVNLWIPNDYYLEFVLDLRYYLQCDIKEVQGHEHKYPVGMIMPKDNKHIPIEIHFMHYASFSEANDKWIERSKRVNYDNLYFIWQYHDEDNEAIRAFDKMNAKKLIILRETMDSIENSQVVSCYKENPYRGKVLELNEKTGKRYLDEIDYVNFLNERS